MIAPEHIRRFEEAMRTEHPFAPLHELASSLRDGGTSQFDLYLLFEHFFILVQDNEPNNEVLYEAITDNMDLIWGWCSSDRSLFETTINEDELKRYRQQA
jgi:hypothetical protein